MTQQRWSIVIGLCCMMVLSSCAGKTKVYERHIQAAYDEKGQVRPGYATLNLEFLTALDADLEACYNDKKP